MLGVGWCNAPWIDAWPGAPDDPGALATAGERWVWVAGQALLQGRMVALLSLLFGASMVWIGGDGRDVKRAALLDRRLLALALLGVLHGALLWWGDILLPYAVTGLALRWCRRWPPRRLLWSGILAYGLGVVVLRIDAGMELWQGHALSTGHMGMIRLAPMADNGRIWLTCLPETMIAVLMTSGPMMAIGMAMARSGRLSTAWLDRRAPWLLTIGLGTALITVPLTLIEAGICGGLSPASASYWATTLRLVCAPAGALGWLGLASLWRQGQSWLAAIGRVSLSTYLGQSMMMRAGVILLGMGASTVSWRGIMADMGLVLGLQVGLAQVWHKFGWPGPAEAWWRFLYRRQAGRPHR